MSIALKSIAAGSAFGLGFVSLGIESFTLQFLAVSALILLGLARELAPDDLPVVESRRRPVTLH